MTRKDYKKAAEIAVQVDGKSHRAEVIEAFVKLFRDDNPRFDEERFREACGKTYTS